MGVVNKTVNKTALHFELFLSPRQALVSKRAGYPSLHSAPFLDMRPSALPADLLETSPFFESHSKSAWVSGDFVNLTWEPFFEGCAWTVGTLGTLTFGTVTALGPEMMLFCLSHSSSGNRNADLPAGNLVPFEMILLCISHSAWGNHHLDKTAGCPVPSEEPG